MSLISLRMTTRDMLKWVSRYAEANVSRLAVYDRHYSPLPGRFATETLPSSRSWHQLSLPVLFHNVRDMLSRALESVDSSQLKGHSTLLLNVLSALQWLHMALLE